MDADTAREQPDSQSLPSEGSSPSPEVLAGDSPDGTGTMTVSMVKLDQFRRELEELIEEAPLVPKNQDTAVDGKQESRTLPAVGLRFSKKMMPEHVVSVIEMVKLQRKNERLEARLEERIQQDKNMTLRIKNLKKNVRRLSELRWRYNTFLGNEYFNPWAERAEKARQEGRQKDKEIKRLKEETARLVEKKQELLGQIELYAQYRDVMEQAAHRGGFESAEHLAEHITRLVHLRDKLIQLENEKLDRIDELKKNLVMMEDQHRLFMLQKHNRLVELDMELEETRAEKQIWVPDEKRWSHIQETATKKTLVLGQIKMATLSIYEMTGDTEVNVNDTEKQLDKIKQFIMDNDDIVKRYQAEKIEELKGIDQKKDKATKSNPPKRH